MSVRRDPGRRDPNLSCPNTSARLDLVLRAGQAHRQLISTGGKDDSYVMKTLSNRADYNIKPAIPWWSMIGEPNQNRVPVKLKGPTIEAPKWSADVEFPEDMREPLDGIYSTLKEAFPNAAGFDFFIDGDPPDKIDPFKLMVADFAQRENNTLTLLRVYDRVTKTDPENENDLQYRRERWVEKLQTVSGRAYADMNERVFIQVLEEGDKNMKDLLKKQETSAQRHFSATNTDASITYKFKKESLVFDVAKEPKLLDQEAYRHFGVQKEKDVWLWVAYHENGSVNSRKITKINGLPAKDNPFLGWSGKVDRDKMEVFFKEWRVTSLIVESQISKELRNDTPEDRYEIEYDKSGDGLGFTNDEGNDYALAVKKKHAVLRIVLGGCGM